MFKKYKFNDFNFRLLVEVIVLNIFGILAVSSANPDYQTKQVFGMVLGVIVMLVFALVDYEFILKFNWLIYAGTVGMLAMILLPVFGDDAGGAQRWIEIAGFRFQPSELAKILIILFFAYFFSKFNEKLNTGKILGLSLILMAVPLVLILKQPDLSTTIVTAVVFCGMIFMAGLSYKIVGGVLGVGVPLIVVLLSLIVTKGNLFLEEYQYYRIMSWIRPDEYANTALQQQNAVTAIGSGRLFGKGLFYQGVDSLKNGNFISEPHTDFIFTIIGEETGFIGSAFVVFMLLAITLECVRIAKKAKNIEGKLIAIGMATLIAAQSFVNICVNTRVLPNTGLTLPFVSYGLTSLVSLYIGIGIVLNVSMQPMKYRGVLK